MPLSRGGLSCRKIRVGTLFTNSLRDAGPRAAGVEGPRAAQELFDMRRSFDLNLRIVQILRNRRTGGWRNLDGRSAAGTTPQRPDTTQPTPSGGQESAERSQWESMANLLCSKG